ncbi:MAG: hypothetical protein K6E19_11160, partial [Lachnospiraceae bacterium]|nr:hypothetical protein [Lachnospiraceae bacterium]
EIENMRNLYALNHQDTPNISVKLNQYFNMFSAQGVRCSIGEDADTTPCINIESGFNCAIRLYCKNSEEDEDSEDCILCFICTMPVEPKYFEEIKKESTRAAENFDLVQFRLNEAMEELYLMCAIPEENGTLPIEQVYPIYSSFMSAIEYIIPEL